MSHFSETLRQLLALKSMKQEALAAASGVDRSIISRMLRDYTPNREQLAALCAAISTDRKDRIQLLVAHLMDEASEVHASGGVKPEDWLRQDDTTAVEAHWFTHLPIGLQTEIHLVIDECKRTPEMRALVSQWAAVVDKHSKELAAKVVPFEALAAEDPAPYQAAGSPTDQVIAAEEARRAQADLARNSASSSSSKSSKA